MTLMDEIDMHRLWYDMNSPNKKTEILPPFRSPSSLPLFSNLLLSSTPLPSF